MITRQAAVYGLYGLPMSKVKLKPTLTLVVSVLQLWQVVPAVRYLNEECIGVNAPGIEGPRVVNL